MMVEENGALAEFAIIQLGITQLNIIQHNSVEHNLLGNPEGHPRRQKAKSNGLNGPTVSFSFVEDKNRPST